MLNMERTMVFYRGVIVSLMGSESDFAVPYMKRTHMRGNFKAPSSGLIISPPHNQVRLEKQQQPR